MKKFRVFYKSTIIPEMWNDLGETGVFSYVFEKAKYKFSKEYKDKDIKLNYARFDHFSAPDKINIELVFFIIDK